MAVIHNSNQGVGLYSFQAPINDYQAAAGFIGLKPTTSKHHMVRAILESLVFRVVQLYDTLQQEAGCDCSLIRVDGGVTHNDFVCQLMADLIEIKVERPTSTEMSVLGVGFLAGLYSGEFNLVPKEYFYSQTETDNGALHLSCV
ncbi:unnamed protein product [Timema podura]|uniref:Carbohydrate kinase FGGY C-terminal domain-containing protein n=1 Tax=Timema podura TaxID=61482 RepID=A0ABN7P389_TIMPD|nr:unnamed protein product [Timema podura]